MKKELKLYISYLEDKLKLLGYPSVFSKWLAKSIIVSMDKENKEITYDIIDDAVNELSPYTKD